MSERKTTEIKLRVTPAEKNSWQLAAEDEGIGLSELIRREMNALANRVTAPGPDERAIGDAIARLHEIGAGSSGAVAALEAARAFANTEIEYISTNVGSTLEARELLTPPIAPTEAVPTSDAESRVAKPWMFEARSSE